MRRIKRALVALILATTLFFNASLGRESAPSDEDEEPLTEYAEPPAPNVAEESTAFADEMRVMKDANRAEERRKYLREVQEEALANEAERQRKAELMAQESRKSAQAQDVTSTPSRSQAYVGQPQTYEITYYTAGCEGCTGQSASGVWVNESTHYEGYRVLAAPKHIPFYSILRITHADGTSYDGIVLDRGGAIKNGRLDVLTATRDEAYRNGRHKAQVQMVRRGK